MHEFAITADLARQVEEIVVDHQVGRVVSIKVAVGALSGIAPDHLRAGLTAALAGTPAGQARLDITVVSDPVNPWATGVWLEGLEVAEELEEVAV